MQIQQNHLQQRLGFLGGGQLARMLALSTHPLGITPHIYSQFSLDPAAQVSSQWHPGQLNDIENLHNFLKKVDLVTFESEFVDTNLLAQAAAGTQVQFFPSLECMSSLQDRLSQKQTLLNFQIPTADFVAVQTPTEDVFNRWKSGAVFKLRTGGYDGKGTFVARTIVDVFDLQKKNLKPNSMIAEELISFQRELAITLVRSRDGSFAELPLVESVQKENRCDYVVGPETHPDLEKLVNGLKKMLDQYNYVGAVSFELFETKKGLLVNEVAPRVHNSAHYSQNALKHSQFELHILAGLGKPLGNPEILCEAFAMVNLIGSHNKLPELKNEFKNSFHWYAKSENRPGRKMGHINATGKNKKTLLNELLKEREKCGL